MQFFLLACMYVQHVHAWCLVPAKSRRGGQILWKRNYKWLWTTLWMLGNKLGFSPECPKLLFTWVGELTYAIALLWRSGDNVQGLVLSFHHVGTRVLGQVIRCGGRHALYLLSHLTGPYTYVCVRMSRRHRLHVTQCIPERRNWLPMGIVQVSLQEHV